MTSHPPVPLYSDKHITYIHSLDTPEAQKTMEYWATEPLRLSGIYWGLASMHLLGKNTKEKGGLDEEGLWKAVQEARQENGR